LTFSHDYFVELGEPAVGLAQSPEISLESCSGETIFYRFQELPKTLEDR
jgi:hypothetical protein